LCGLACKDDAPAAVKNHFERRMVQLDLLGKPAPAISGTDLDGHQVSLADLKGKVVLVNFWEPSCSRCVATITARSALAQKYHPQGFVILGVNVDRRHPDITDAKTVLPAACRFQTRPGVTSINLLDGQATGNITTAYGIEEKPANILIGQADSNITAHGPPRHVSSGPRLSRTPRVASIKTFDDDGKILGPSTIRIEADAANLRQDAEKAVQTVVHESKSTGHTSV
jgi:thiol-disulfide isomerase/thioredoxin